MRGSNTVNPRGSNTSSNSGGGVSKYTELENRPNQLITETIIPSTSTGGEFIPTVANNESASVTENGSTISTTRTGSGWGGSGTFSTENIPVGVDGYISFKNGVDNKNYMVGLSRISDATSSTYTTIDYAIFIVTKDRVQIYENAANRGDFSFTGSLDDVYKVEKTGTVIKYYRNTTLIHTSTVATTEALYLDTAFKTTGSIVTNIRMLNTPLVITPETTDYKLYLNNNPNVIGYHIDELVSDTDFADIDAALADDAVKKAIAGDFVMIASKIYHVIKTNPTIAAHLRLNDETIDDATDAEVTAGTVTDPRLFTPKQIGDKVNNSVPAKATTAEMIAGTETGVRGMSPKLIKDEIDIIVGDIPSASDSDITSRISTTSGTISVKQVADLATSLISEIPDAPTGGGVADSVPWRDITGFPPLFTITDEPISVNPTFVNSGGVTIIYRDDGADVECTAGGWGSSGTWDEDNNIVADGGVSFIITSTPSQSEQMLGLSYKNSEADATSITFQLIDYAWYFRASDQKAFVREALANGSSNTNVNAYSAKVFDAFKVYSIQRVGTKINYLIDGVVVYTSAVDSTGTLHIDVALSRVNSAFSQIRIQRNLTKIHDTKIDYNSSEVINKPTIPTLPATSTSTEITTGTITDTRLYSPSVIKAAIDTLIAAGGDSSVLWKDINGMPPLFDITDGALPTNPNFENTYKGGVSVTESSTGVTVKCTTAGWGNSGVWDNDNTIEANGSVSFIVDSTPNQTECILGLSYKNSESDATSKTLDLTDYAWYFLAPTRKAYIRESNSSGDTSAVVTGTGELFDSSKVYGINRVGNKINYLIDGVVVHTSSQDSTGTLYLDLGFNLINSSFSQIRIQDDSIIVRDTKLDYLNPNFINKPEYLQEVRKSYSDELNLVMAGATAYNITGLDVAITPKRATSKFVISFDIKATAPIGHIFSFSIYIGDTKVNQGTSTLHNVDAVVPVPTTSGGRSVLNSVMGSVETSHQPLLQSMTVKVKAWYHKDSSATDDTSTLTLNRATSNISGLTYKMQGTSMLRVQEIEV